MTIPAAAWALAAAALVAIYLCIYSLLHRRHRAALHVLWTVTALLVWIVPYMIEIVAESQESMILWANIQFIGIGATPLLWFATTRTLLGRRPLRPATTVVIALIPVATVVLAFTDSWHGLFRSNPEVVRVGGMVLLHASYGWWHNIVFISYQYILYIASLLVIVAEWSSSSPAYRGRYPALMLAMILPMVGGGLYVLEVTPFENFNPTAILILISFVLFLWVVTRHRVLDIVPIARERVVDTLSEAIVVLDQAGRIVDFNPAAGDLFPELTPQACGQPFAEVMEAHIALQLLAQGIESENTGFQIEDDAGSKYCMAQSSEVAGLDGLPIGRTISVTDISAQVALIQSSAVDTSENSRVRSPRSFMELGRLELSRALHFGRPLHIGAIDGGGAGISEEELHQQMGQLLGEYEFASNLGVGRYLFLFPEIPREEAERRMAQLHAACAMRMGSPRSGLAGTNGGSSNQLEQLITDALEATRWNKTAAAKSLGITFRALRYRLKKLELE